MPFRHARGEKAWVIAVALHEVLRPHVRWRAPALRVLAAMVSGVWPRDGLCAWLLAVAPGGQAWPVGAFWRGIVASMQTVVVKGAAHVTASPGIETSRLAGKGRHAPLGFLVPRTWLLRPRLCATL